MSTLSAQRIWFVLAVTTATGCILGPQPEPPDVDDDRSADEDLVPPYAPDDGVDDDAFEGEPGPCDPGLAGGEWNCEGDRDGHDLPCDRSGEVIENSARQMVVPLPIDSFFDDEDDPDPSGYYDELGDDDDDDDDDDGALVGY